MVLLTNDPIEILKRKATVSILGVTALGGILATYLHSFNPKTHPLSLVIPPATVIISLSLLIYLFKQPAQTYRVMKILLGWSSLIIIVPVYFFVMEAWLFQETQLIDTLPPISSGLFLLTTSMIVFLRPQKLVRWIVLIWVVIATPIIIYLIFHLPELTTPRGVDLMITLLPATSINLFLVMFYAQLQDAIAKLYIERFHLQEISEKDALTGVFNRGTGERILQNLIDQSDQQIGIILCDIDRFKQINDNYGHLMGDRVIQIITQCCQSQLSKKDVLIRWGGEEFVIVVTGDQEQELKHLAERLRWIIAEQNIPEVGKVTASFGVALLQPSEGLSQLFERADQALYQAKNLGRDRVVLA